MQFVDWYAETLERRLAEGARGPGLTEVKARQTAAR